MNSNTRLFHLSKSILSFEEKICSLYEEYLSRLNDPDVTSALIEIRDREAARVKAAQRLLEILKKYESKSSPTALPTHKGFSTPMLGIIIGILLGLGAPIGSLFLKIVWGRQEQIVSLISNDWTANQWFYTYMTVGTVLVLSVVGWWVGTLQSKLSAKTEDFSLKARVLEDLSVRDSLTGLFNYGHIRDKLVLEMERSRRFHAPLSCLMLDIDNLKEINDGHGHLAGDATIRQVSNWIQKEVRNIDTLTRYGGDEFLLIMPATGPEDAVTEAERIRKLVKENAVVYEGGPLRVSLSVGVATFPYSNVVDTDTLVAAADQAVYQSKIMGRDRTTEAPQPSSL